VAQRSAQTLAGLLAREDRKAALELHRNAQTMLEPLKVVNPYADSLTFLDAKTRTRRDHMKYLTLIQAVALLHQHQRPIREVVHQGRALRYIEVEESDISLANRLAGEVLGRTLDELPPQTRTLLDRLHRWGQEQCEAQAIRRADFRFTRSEVRELTGWGDTQTKLHLSRLAELEYLLIHRVKGGQAFDYELLYDGEGDQGSPFIMGLSSPNPIYDSARAGVKPERSAPIAERAGRGRPEVGPRSGGGRADETAAKGQECAPNDDSAPNPAKTHLRAITGKSQPYPRVIPPLPTLAASAAG
jgi:PAS domain-containing protein